MKPVYILVEFMVCNLFRRTWRDEYEYPYNRDVINIFLPVVMHRLFTSLWWCHCVCILDLRDGKHVYILMVVTLCIHIRRAACEANLHPYSCVVVYAFPTYMKWSPCTSLCWCRCESISAVRDIKPVYVLIVCFCECISAVSNGNPVYILKMVPLCMHVRSAWCEVSVHPYGSYAVYALPQWVMWSQWTS
jgi:hypothetical protein